MLFAHRHEVHYCTGESQIENDTYAKSFRKKHRIKCSRRRSEGEESLACDAIIFFFMLDIYFSHFLYCVRAVAFIFSAPCAAGFVVSPTHHQHGHGHRHVPPLCNIAVPDFA